MPCGGISQSSALPQKWRQACTRLHVRGTSSICPTSSRVARSFYASDRLRLLKLLGHVHLRGIAVDSLSLGVLVQVAADDPRASLRCPLLAARRRWALSATSSAMPDIQVANSHLIGLWLQILATGMSARLTRVDRTLFAFRSPSKLDMICLSGGMRY